MKNPPVVDAFGEVVCEKCGIHHRDPDYHKTPIYVKVVVLISVSFIIIDTVAFIASWR